MFKKVMNIIIFALIFALYFVSFLMIFDSFKERKLASLEKNAIDVFDKEVKIEREQEEFRERIRNRLNQNIPGNGSSSDN